VTANNSSVLEQAFERGPNRVGRNCKTNSLRATGGGGDCGVDTDHFAAKVDQRSTAVPRINRCIGLNETAKEICPVRSPFRADDSVCHGFLKSKWIADCQNKISGLDHIGIGKFERLDARIVNLEHSEIDLSIRADQSRLPHLAIAQLHLNLINRITFAVSHHVT